MLISEQKTAVINALSLGLSTTDAATAAGVHRNTIDYWRIHSLPFREALARAHYDRAILFREKAEDLVNLAYQTLHDLLADPKASPSARLKAATFIIGTATAPPPQIEEIPPEPDGRAEPISPKMHKNAQTESQPEAPAPIQTIRRDSPKIGRNDVCPCGSGLKHKRCCLNLPHANSVTA